MPVKPASLPADSAMPQLSIVIVTWNSAEMTLRCLAALASTTTVRFEILVVDNASTDNTAARIHAEYPDARILENPVNRGFAQACNQGMAAARAPFVLLLNSDAIVHDDVITRAVTWLKQHPDVDMVGCEVRWPDGRRVYTANRSLSIRRSLAESLWLYKLLPPARRATFLLDGYWNGTRDIQADWLVGVFLCFRRELFDNTGGFDPQFFMYGEDCEWGIRLTRGGYRLVYSPRLGYITHVGAASSAGTWDEHERLRLGHIGGIRAYALIHGRRRAALYRLSMWFGSAVRWSVYSALVRARTNDYLARQHILYRWQMEFYGASSGRSGLHLVYGSSRAESVARNAPPAPPPRR